MATLKRLWPDDLMIVAPDDRTYDHTCNSWSMCTKNLISTGYCVKHTRIWWNRPWRRLARWWSARRAMNASAPEPLAEDLRSPRDLGLYD